MNILNAFLALLVFFNFVSWSRPGVLGMMDSLIPFSRLCGKTWLTLYPTTVISYFITGEFIFDIFHVIWLALLAGLAYVIIKDLKNDKFDVMDTMGKGNRGFLFLGSTIILLVLCFGAVANR